MKKITNEKAVVVVAQLILELDRADRMSWRDAVDNALKELGLARDDCNQSIWSQP